MRRAQPVTGVTGSNPVMRTMSNLIQQITDVIDNDVHIQYQLELKDKYELCAGNYHRTVLKDRCKDCDEYLDDCVCSNKIMIH